MRRTSIDGKELHNARCNILDVEQQVRGGSSSFIYLNSKLGEEIS
jgi:hypothetical protein